MVSAPEVANLVIVFVVVRKHFIASARVLVEQGIAWDKVRDQLALAGCIHWFDKYCWATLPPFNLPQGKGGSIDCYELVERYVLIKINFII